MKKSINKLKAPLKRLWFLLVLKAETRPRLHKDCENAKAVLNTKVGF